MSLVRLVSAGLIALERADERVSVSLAPLLARTAPELSALLYRDFFDRHGRELKDTAAFHLDSLAEDIAELAEGRPRDPRVQALLSDYEALKASSTPDQLLAAWHEDPRPTYAWLADLAAIEERLAILKQHRDTSLAGDLVRHASERI